ncbi:quinoprotein dehydrogenase-associated putative ABC transporter substrate-binding protein [Coralloluteibacterium stylophorae]|nr:quinoprotein dehydrogenase-associated putative ABC transporter substrate-binding protein [Coralloluteibacterium stylophorae]
MPVGTSGASGAPRQAGGAFGRPGRVRAPRGRGRARLGAALLALLAAGGAQAAPAGQQAATPQALRICADPGNMPLSNRAGEGFQNRIAEVLGEAMGLPVEYFWKTYYQLGLARNTINAGNCDVLMDMTSDFEMGLATRPLYRSTYVLVTRKGIDLELDSLDDPRLRKLRVGVFQSSPARQALYDHGVRGEVQYLFYDSAARPEDHPGKLVEEVAAGRLDAAESWGPVAGYYARRAGLPMHPLNVLDDEVLEYSVSLAVARDNRALKERLEQAMVAERDAIRAILDEYNVPLVQCAECVVSGALPSHGPYPEATDTGFRPQASPQALTAMQARLARGATPDAELENAIVGMDPGRIAWLLEHGADADAAMAQGGNALHLAIRNEQPQLVRQLLEAGADVEARNRDGWTPLMLAAWQDQPEAVDLLLGHGADVGAVGGDGWTALTLAITYGDGEMVRRLVEAGADADAANPSGFTPLMFAVTRNQPDTLDLLLTRGAAVDRANAAGVTPLMMAAAGAQEPLVRRLLAAGADPGLRDAQGNSAADIARRAGSPDLARTLDEAIAPVR